MNEFMCHVLGTMERHEYSINKLTKSCKKLNIAMIVLAGFSIYQAMRIDDLKFELDKEIESKKQDSI